jgi:DNA-binding transcriptional LysR family regulator
MEMQQVRYFMALAKVLNFTRAAEQCNVSQPALTRAIQQLEHELGGPLFNRERGNTHLSELGKMMLPFLESVEASTRAAKEAAQSAKKLENVALTIGTMCTISPSLVSGLMVRFQMDHPDVELVVSDADSSDTIAALEKGDLELAIIGSPEDLPDNLHQLPVFEERFVIIVAKGHPWEGKNAIRAQELDGQAYVTRSNCEMFQFAGDDFARRGIAPRSVFSSPRDDWVQGMVKAGLGYGFFPESCVTDPELVVRPLIDPGYSRTVYIATVRGRPHSPAVGAFVQAARKHQWPKPNAAMWQLAE